MILETKRLRLRAIELKDHEVLFETRNDPSCAKYQEWEKTSEADLLQFIRDNESRTIGDDQVQLALALRTDDVMIGDLFLAKKDKTLTLGFTLATPHQHQGYMTEALQCFILYLQSRFPDCELCALVHPENTASVSLLERLHFTKAEYIEEFHSQVYVIQALVQS